MRSASLERKPQNQEQDNRILQLETELKSQNQRQEANDLRIAQLEDQLLSKSGNQKQNVKSPKDQVILLLGNDMIAKPLIAKPLVVGKGSTVGKERADIQDSATPDSKKYFRKGKKELIPPPFRPRGRKNSINVRNSDFWGNYSLNIDFTEWRKYLTDTTIKEIGRENWS